LPLEVVLFWSGADLGLPTQGVADTTSIGTPSIPSVRTDTMAIIITGDADRLRVPVLCVRGADEDESACGRLNAPRLKQ
jgi:hypothetical protein